MSRPFQCSVLLVTGGTTRVCSYRNLDMLTELAGDKSRPKQAERVPLSVLLFLYKSCFWLFLCNRNHYQVSTLSYPHWHIKSHALVLGFCEPAFVSSPSGFDLEAIGTGQSCVGFCALCLRDFWRNLSKITGGGFLPSFPQF